MSPPTITLTTDFGAHDLYVGVMKGVILSINPQMQLVDLCHNVGPQNIQQTSFLVGKSHRFFPVGTTHVIVVDPGVGTSRRGLLLVTPSACFIGPDNGVFSHVLVEGFDERPTLSREGVLSALPPGYKAYSLTNPTYWQHPVSSTFHGRDIFGPVAGHLSLGVAPEEMGEEVYEVTCLSIVEPEWRGDTIHGFVVHIDGFGNLVTDIPAEILPNDGAVDIEVMQHRIKGLSSTYAEGGDQLALVGSYNTLELSKKNGDIANSLGVRVGDLVSVVRR